MGISSGAAGGMTAEGAGFAEGGREPRDPRPAYGFPERDKSLC